MFALIVSIISLVISVGVLIFTLSQWPRVTDMPYMVPPPTTRNIYSECPKCEKQFLQKLDLTTMQGELYLHECTSLYCDYSEQFGAVTNE